METRCKFSCSGVSEIEHGYLWRFYPVWHGDDPNHENAKFNEASPNGYFELTVDKEHYKGEHPVSGKEYYFNITEA